MNSDRDDPNGDPQQTLPPGQYEPRRIVLSQPDKDVTAGAKGRRLRLGTPTRHAPPPPRDREVPEISASVQRGFNLGADPKADVLPASSPRTGVQPWILCVAAGAIVLLFLALFLRPSSGGSAEAIANERLLTQYTKYLEAKGQKDNADVNERRREVVGRLQAVAWAKALGDKAALESELSGLLFLDNDKNSPLYQYSVSQLKQLGPSKKAAGL